jgi:hypothetical protein
MPGSEIFLDYNGPINQEKIDLLLKKLKKTQGFTRLSKTTGKRVYAILVECLENIAKHSLKELPSGIRKHTFVYASDRSNIVLIKTGNVICDERKVRLAKILDNINMMAQDDLSQLYEEIINKESKPESNGAGLGFIIMKLKSGNKIDYNFKEIGNGFSDFEIEILVNKHTMRKLFIEQTTNSPKVYFDPEKNIFEISGESRPPDVVGFYTEIMNWIDDYSSHISNSQEVKEPAVFNLDFEYFNSSSAKYILDFCKQLAAVRLKGENIAVKWHHEADDLDMLEVGKEMSRMAKFPFEYVQKTS